MHAPRMMLMLVPRRFSCVSAPPRCLQVKGAHILDYTDTAYRAAIIDSLNTSLLQTMSDSSKYPRAGEYLLLPPIVVLPARGAFALSRSMHRKWVSAFFSPPRVHRLLEVNPPTLNFLTMNPCNVSLSFSYDRAQCEEAAAAARP
jgi:hypothetical protein